MASKRIIILNIERNGWIQFLKRREREVESSGYGDLFHLESGREEGRKLLRVLFDKLGE